MDSDYEEDEHQQLVVLTGKPIEPEGTTLRSLGSRIWLIMGIGAGVLWIIKLLLEIAHYVPD